MPINSFLYPAPSNSNPFEVANSLRFDDGSADSLTQTGSGSGFTTGTLSAWVKRGKLAQSNPQSIWAYQDGTSNASRFLPHFDNGSDQFFVYAQPSNGSGTAIGLKTNREFRDLSAWYHILVEIDTTQSTSSNRVKLYINGTQETSFGTETYPDQNYVVKYMSSTSTSHVGNGGGGSNNYYFSGYMAEVCFVDGQALGPTSFGEFDSANPTIWKPKEILTKLDFGTNGFYLQFKNSSSLGTDSSLSGNNFTVNNLTSIDQTTDTCTNNFATLNPLTNEDTDITLSQGNLDYTNSGSGDETVFASIGVSSGKWYFETKWTDTSNYMDIGVGSADEGDIGSPRADAEGTGYYMIQLRTSSPGTRAFNNGSAGSGLGNSALNDINMFAIDMDNNKFYAGKNGTWYSSGDPANNSNPLITMDDGFTTLIPIVCGKSNSAVSVNFGSPSYSISSGNADANGFGNFEYAVPSGFFAFCTKNLAEHG